MLKIKKTNFFPEHRYEWPLLRQNIKNAEKKFWENGGILCFGGS